MKRMKVFNYQGRRDVSSQQGCDEAAYPLNVAGVYQDSVTRGWAVQAYLPPLPQVEKDQIRKKWYDVHSLSEPEILLEAVLAAAFGTRSTTNPSSLNQ